MTGEDLTGRADYKVNRQPWKLGETIRPLVHSLRLNRDKSFGTDYMTLISGHLCSRSDLNVIVPTVYPQAEGR